jgi:hypothetical protein
VGSPGKGVGLAARVLSRGRVVELGAIHGAKFVCPSLPGVVVAGPEFRLASKSGSVVEPAW